MREFDSLLMITLLFESSRTILWQAITSRTFNGISPTDLPISTVKVNAAPETNRGETYWWVKISTTYRIKHLILIFKSVKIRRDLNLCPYSGKTAICEAHLGRGRAGGADS